jgi:hypothetical protein
MTWADSTTPIEEMCHPSHAGELWKEQGSPDEIWLVCDRCRRELPGPASPSLAIAAGRGLAAGWSMKRCNSQSPLPEVATMRDLIDLSEMFCPSCTTEMDVRP